MEEIISFINIEHATAAIAGGVIVWILDRLKSIFEYQKLRNEILAIQIKSNESYHQIDQKRREVTKKASEAMKSIYAAKIRGDAKKMSEARWKFIEFFSIEYLPTYDSFIKIGQFVYARDKKSFIVVDIFPFLEVCCTILEFINQDEIINMIGEPKHKLKENDLFFALHFVRRNLSRCDHVNYQRLVAVYERFSFDPNNIGIPFCAQMKIRIKISVKSQNQIEHKPAAISESEVIVHQPETIS